MDNFSIIILASFMPRQDISIFKRPMQSVHAYTLENSTQGHGKKNWEMKGVYGVRTSVIQNVMLEPTALVSPVSLVELQIHWPHFSLWNQNLRGGAQDTLCFNSSPGDS